MSSATDDKSTSISMRPYRDGNLDAIVEMVLAAFPFDDEFSYNFPYQHEYPEDHPRFTQLYYAEYVSSSSDRSNTIILAEAPDLTDLTKVRVIAIGIWGYPGTTSPSSDQGLSYIMKLYIIYL